jgi:hypothetical protein
MYELSRTYLRIDIRELDDPESESGRAWIVDVLDLTGEVVIESAGVASGIPSAIAEAGHAIALYLADQWEMTNA